jgi:hypothetical protein
METAEISGTSAKPKAKPRGKPFQKGQSGNAGGRPKKTQEEMDLIAACREKTPAALATILDIMDNGQERSRLAAAQVVIERGWGKAVQPVESSGPNGGPIETVQRIELVALDGNGAS